MIKKDMREEMAKLLTEMQQLHNKLANVHDRLMLLHGEMRNRPPKTRGDPTSHPIDAGIRRKVLQLHKQAPDMPQHEIAKAIGINQGRVSEIIAGKRT